MLTKHAAQQELELTVFNRKMGRERRDSCARPLSAESWGPLAFVCCSLPPPPAPPAPLASVPPPDWSITGLSSSPIGPRDIIGSSYLFGPFKLI